MRLVLVEDNCGLLQRLADILHGIAALWTAQRQATQKTIANLLAALGRLVDLTTPVEYANMFAAQDYDAIWKKKLWLHGHILSIEITVSALTARHAQKIY